MGAGKASQVNQIVDIIISSIAIIFDIIISIIINLLAISTQSGPMLLALAPLSFKFADKKKVHNFHRNRGLVSSVREAVEDFIPKIEFEHMGVR